MDPETLLRFSILTPTYNRAHTLPKVYQSLRQQTLQDLEWIVVDDGSSDTTTALIKYWQKEAPFPIRYFKQANVGHHVATNKAIQEAKGEFCVLLDSDDQLVSKGLERFLALWETIPVNQRQGFVGVTALIATEKGQILGGKFPQDIFDSDSTTVGYILRLGDDRKGMLRTEVLKQYLYPVFQKEKFISDSIIWHRIAKTYQTRFVNEVVCISDYLPDGQTLNTVRLLSNNPKGSSLYYQELLNDPHPFSYKVRTGIHAYFVRYSLHACYGWHLIFRVGSKRPLFLGLGVMLGIGLFLRDRFRQKQTQKVSKSNFEELKIF
jgi:glycosyltransferase involved in cell wall biosynthesis